MCRYRGDQRQGARHSQNEDSPETEPTSTDVSRPFSVKGFTLGVLLEIDNMFLFGTGYTFDVRHFRDKYKEIYNTITQE